MAQEIFSPERTQQALENTQRTIASFGGLDPDKSLYENLRSVATKGPVLALQMLPAFRAASAGWRILAAVGAGGALEAGAQQVDKATGHPETDSPVLDVVKAGATAGATEAVPAALGAAAQKIFRPTQKIVSNAYDAVTAAVGPKALIDTGNLQAEARAVIAKYKSSSSVLPETGDKDLATIGPYLRDLELGNRLTFEQSQTLKDGLQKIRNSDDAGGAIARRLLGHLEEARTNLAEAAGAGEQYKYAKTLYNAKEAHSTGVISDIQAAAMGPVQRLMGVRGLPAAVAKEATDTVVQRLMTNPKYADQMEQVVHFLNNKQSSAAGPLLTRMITNVLGEKLASSSYQPEQPPLY